MTPSARQATVNIVRFGNSKLLNAGMRTPAEYRTNPRYAESGMTRRLSLAALLLCALAAQSRVYTGSRAYIPHEVRLRAETNVVQMAVTVRDSRGQPVAGLTAADFRLFDRGEPQNISGFSVESNSPQAAPGAALSPS